MSWRWTFSEHSWFFSVTNIYLMKYVVFYIWLSLTGVSNSIYAKPAGALLHAGRLITLTIWFSVQSGAKTQIQLIVFLCYCVWADINIFYLQDAVSMSSPAFLLSLFVSTNVLVSHQVKWLFPNVTLLHSLTFAGCRMAAPEGAVVP